MLAQIALGIVNVWAGKHAGLILGHLALGTVLWSTVVYAGATLLPASEPASERLRRREVTEPYPPRPAEMESATTTQHPGRGGTLEPAHVPEALRVPHRAGERSIAAILRDYVALTNRGSSRCCC